MYLEQGGGEEWVCVSVVVVVVVGGCVANVAAQEAGGVEGAGWCTHCTIATSSGECGASTRVLQSSTSSMFPRFFTSASDGFAAADRHQ